MAEFTGGTHAEHRAREFAEGDVSAQAAKRKPRMAEATRAITRKSALTTPGKEAAAHG
jgi:hypothetical protein